MLWIVVNGGKSSEGIGATEAVTVMPRAEYEFYFSSSSWAYPSQHGFKGC